MKAFWLIIPLLLLAGCGETVDIASLPEGSYVSCEQMRDPICTIDKDVVCAKIKIVGKLTDNIEWEEFFNGCKACQASTKEEVVMGFEKGKCGLSEEEMNPTGLTIDIPELGAKRSKCISEPPETFAEACRERNGMLKPMKMSGDCVISYHCIVRG